MNCPKCNITLLMTDRQGVEIDYCPQCRGIWLDRGELEKIIDRSMGMNPGIDQGAGAPMGFSDNQYNKHHDHDDHDDHRGYNGAYGQRRKKGFLGELFDF